MFLVPNLVPANVQNMYKRGLFVLCSALSSAMDVSCMFESLPIFPFKKKMPTLSMTGQVFQTTLRFTNAENDLIYTICFTRQ